MPLISYQVYIQKTYINYLHHVYMYYTCKLAITLSRCITHTNHLSLHIYVHHMFITSYNVLCALTTARPFDARYNDRTTCGLHA
jgi:hypothetical protein